MKKKLKLVLGIFAITLTMVLLSVNIINASITDLHKLKGTKNKKINTSYTLSYSDLIKNDGLYCIQRHKTFRGSALYTVQSYVEIDGKQAKVYTSSKDTDPKIVKSSLNAQVAYILSLNEGYGTSDNPTSAQDALWHITNDWTTKIFGNSNYVWELNNKAEANSINKDAVKYAESVGDSTTTEITSENNMVDKTNKEDLSILYTEDGYYRVGPFKWKFDGKLSEIKVTGNNGTISSDKVRFVKYEGSEPKIVDESKILSGESFYVDVHESTGTTKITKLSLKTDSAEESKKVYTAKIWFLKSKYMQNVIYVDVGSANGTSASGESDYDASFTTSIGLKKVDDRDTSKPLVGVGFKFKANVYRYIIVGSHYEWKDTNNDGIDDTRELVYDREWRWVEKYLGNNLTWNSSFENAKIFYTNNNGIINIGNISAEQTISLKAIEVSNPYYGYTVGQEYSINSVYENVQLYNHQKLVKLSGYVWLDQNDGKTTVRNDIYDEGKESGYNGIKVYLKDTSGRIVKVATTSELGLYSEIQGGEYQFVDVDLDELQKGSYYIEFEYCGITYQSVTPNINNNKGSKAVDTTTRNILDNKFASVNSTGSQTLKMNDVIVNYNGNSNYTSTVKDHSGCNVYARTSEASYNLYRDFVPTSAEIRNINLGIFEKAQTDFALTQDLYNVRASVNGFSHIYRYATVRYSNNGETVDENSSWNVGVKFQNNIGTYSRAIYKSDAYYEAKNHVDNELKVYVTYKVALKNESTYLGRINSIVDYCDNNFELIAAGTSIDNSDQISGNKKYSAKTSYNNEYSKYIIDVDSIINPGETNYIYLQFKLDRQAVLTIMNDGELLNNVTEINSYTTFKNNNSNTPVAVIDKDSVPGNIVPGKIATYEDDTDAARSLKLELKNERDLTGTVFVDSTGKDINAVYTNQERLGNGVLDNGETPLVGIKVKLRETGKDDSSYDGERIEMETTTDENGNFTFSGYIPGKYTLTYIWGDNTYKVQYYKGTIYDETRNQKDTYWYKDNVDTRKTDALDSLAIREQIDNEMEAIKINTLDSEINAAYEGKESSIKTTTMESTTPVMDFSVEYNTTITDGTQDEVKFTVKNVDFGIVERAKQQLEFSKRVKAFKLTLSNGQVLADAEITEDGKLKGSHQYVTYMAPTTVNGISSKGTIKIETDTELLEGATIEMTYELKVKNVGELDYVSDKYYYYGNKSNSDKVRVSVTGLIDYLENTITVVDDKWEQKDNTILSDVNARQKDNVDYLSKVNYYYTTHLSKDLAPEESNVVTLSTSKLLTTTDDIKFNNQAEIAEVTKQNTFNSGSPVKINWDDTKSYFEFADSEELVIVPSTGENKNYELPIIIGLTAVVLLGAGVFIIKKKVVDNK